MGVLDSLYELRGKREKYDGRAVFAKYDAWRKKSRKMMNDETLREWDERHNNRGLQKAWGDRLIHEEGLLALYRQFVNTFSIISVQHGGKTIRLRGFRNDGKGLRSTVVLSEIESDQKEFIVAKLKREAKGLVQRTDFFSLDVRTVRRVINEAIDEWETEKLIAAD